VKDLVLAAKVSGRSGYVAISLYDPETVMEWAEKGYEVFEVDRGDAVRGFNEYANQQVKA
jgi:hypothetical protein